MPARALLLPAFTAVSATEVMAVFAIAGIAYFLAFNNFERHLPLPRRVTKLFVVVGILTAFGVLLGKVAFWGIITLMTFGQIYLHGWYFPKHGINGLTAEPYEKYLETIEKMKGGKQP